MREALERGSKGGPDKYCNTLERSQGVNDDDVLGLSKEKNLISSFKTILVPISGILNLKTAANIDLYALIVERESFFFSHSQSRKEDILAIVGLEVE